MNKTALLLILSPLVAFSSRAIELESPKKMGKPNWRLSVSTGNEGLSPGDVLMSKIPPPRGAMDAETIPTPEKKFPIRRSEIASYRAFFGKYLEWSSVAKKTSIASYQKEIGETKLGAKFVFVVKDRVSYLLAKGFNTDLLIDDLDVSHVVWLLDQLQKAEDAASGAEKTTQKDPRDALFK